MTQEAERKANGRSGSEKAEEEWQGRKERRGEGSGRRDLGQVRLPQVCHSPGANGEPGAGVGGIGTGRRKHTLETAVRQEIRR